MRALLSITLGYMNVIAEKQEEKLGKGLLEFTLC